MSNTLSSLSRRLHGSLTPEQAAMAAAYRDSVLQAPLAHHSVLSELMASQIASGRTELTPSAFLSAVADRAEALSVTLVPEHDQAGLESDIQAMCADAAIAQSLQEATGLLVAAGLWSRVASSSQSLKRRVGKLSPVRGALDQLIQIATVLSVRLSEVTPAHNEHGNVQPDVKAPVSTPAIRR